VFRHIMLREVGVEKAPLQAGGSSDGVWAQRLPRQAALTA
jgi:hypothetical protein